MDSMPPKKVNHDLPDNLTFDPQKGKYRYNNKLTGKRPWLGSDKEKAIELAKKANLAISLQTQTNPLVPTIGCIIDKMLEEWIPEQPYSKGTLHTKLTRFNAIKDEFGSSTFNQITRKTIYQYLSNRCDRGDTFNQWRKIFIDIWNFAIIEELININEAELVPRRSTSKKIGANKKKRKRLTNEQFWAIHDTCPAHVQIAMRQSLITLQAREQLCDTHSDHYKDDGFLYVIRKKTAAETDMAFIRIEITDDIQQIWKDSRGSGVLCPYLVHKNPGRTDRERMNRKPHWAYIWPEQLSRHFAAARDATGLFDDYGIGEKPTLHEVRSLGGRIYRAAGYSEEYVRGLMGHGDVSTTQIYLENPDKLTSDNFKVAKAGLTINKARSMDV